MVYSRFEPLEGFLLESETMKEAIKYCACALVLACSVPFVDVTAGCVLTGLAWVFCAFALDAVWSKEGEVR